MPRKTSFIAVTAASITLAAFVTLEYTFGDVFNGTVSSDVSDTLAGIWGGTPPPVILLVALAIIYILVATVGAALGVLTYALLRRIFATLASFRNND